MRLKNLIVFCVDWTPFNDNMDKKRWIGGQNRAELFPHSDRITHFKVFVSDIILHCAIWYLQYVAELKY